MNNDNHQNNEGVIKFKVPQRLKQSLIELAHDRNISLSALLRLITTEYIKRGRSPS